MFVIDTRYSTTSLSNCQWLRFLMTLSLLSSLKLHQFMVVLERTLLQPALLPKFRLGMGVSSMQNILPSISNVKDFVLKPYQEVSTRAEAYCDGASTVLSSRLALSISDLVIYFPVFVLGYKITVHVLGWWVLVRGIGLICWI